MAHENISHIELELHEVSYRICNDDCPESEVKSSYTCHAIPLDKGKQKQIRYQLNITRTRNGSAGYEADIRLLVTVVWKRIPTMGDIKEGESRLRYISSCKAAKIIYEMTNETLGIPDIFPPYFDEDVELAKNKQEQ